MDKQQIKRRKEIIELYRWLTNNGVTMGMLLEEITDLYGFRFYNDLAQILCVSNTWISLNVREKRVIKDSTYLYYLERLDEALELDIKELKEFIS